MLPIFTCHALSGSSVKQFKHYEQESKFGFFGKYMENQSIPHDFALSRISIPLTVHYSAYDTLGDPIDVQKTISKFAKNVIYEQYLNDFQFNHIDFNVGMNTAALVYSKILNHFEKY